MRYVPETDSTNRLAREWATQDAASGATREGAAETGAALDGTVLDGAALDGAVVVTDHQTAGRGRFERTWTSAPGQNLLLTIILKRNLPRPELLPLAAGLAVRSCVASSGVIRSAQVKWPNDVRIEGRKIAGILVESPEQGVYLVGIGLNVNQDAFPSDVAGEPTSLLLESGQRTDRAEVYYRLLEEMDQALDLLSTGSMLDEYRRHLEGVGEHVRLEDGRTGTLRGVGESGGLVIQGPDGPFVVHSGDVSLRPPEGLSS